MDAKELERLRREYADIIAAVDQYPDQTAYYFGQLEVVAKSLLRLIDRTYEN